MVVKELARRIIDLSYGRKLSHLGSCLSVLLILIEIYEKKNLGDKVFLSGAHSHLAHLVVREEYEGLQDIEDLLEKYGIHCDIKAGCDASGGSLGHLGIALGMALANPKNTVYAVITDGSFMEGSEWEALRISSRYRYNLANLKIYTNFNNCTATESPKLAQSKISQFVSGLDCVVAPIEETNNMIPLLDGVQGHYLVLNDETYKQAIKELEDLP